MKNILRKLLYVRKSDRRAVLFLLCLITVATTLIYLTGSYGGDVTPFYGDTLSHSRGDDTMRRHSGREDGRKKETIYYAVESRQTQLFPFDPNTADSTQLLSLGLSPWQVRSIYRYRAKGGIFREPSDFAKLYGLTIKEYRRLKPYIRISPDYMPASTLFAKEETVRHKRDTLRYPVKLKPSETIELNHADTNALKKVPGIGSGFARSIVYYRERLGGFHSVEQLMEIENFPEKSLDYFTIESATLRKININKLSVTQLRRHPYINFHQAKAIDDYRRLHGDIKSLQELSLNRDFTPAAIERLEPYVEY